MQGSDFIFCLQDSQYRFWQIDDTGMVTKSSKPYFLDFSPDGWNDITVNNIRNKKYWGIDRTVSVPLSYVQDGATILKYIFYKYGIEESVYLSISNQQITYTPGVDYGYWYQQIYKGEVDLSTFDHVGSKVTCTTLEDGLAKFLKANENTPFEFPMNVPEAVFIKMDGIVLQNNSKYVSLGITDGADAFPQYKNLSTIPLNLTTQDGDSYGLVYLSVSPEGIDNEFNDADYLANSENFAIKNEGTVSVTFPITGHIDFKCNANALTEFTNQGELNIYFKTSSGVRYNIDTDDLVVAGQEYVIPFSFDVTLNPGEKLFPFKYIEPIGRFPYSIGDAHFFSTTFTEIEYHETSEMNVSASTRKPTTYIRGFRLQYLFALLINKITDGKYSAAISAYFQKYSQIIITCGNAIRGFDDAVMKISLYELFQFLDCEDSVGLSEKSITVNFDDKIDLLDYNSIIDLPEPANIKVSIAKEYLYNVLNIGYPEIRNDIGVLNGNEEFNCGYTFSLGTTKSPAVLDKVSKIKASCYEIELIRVTTLNKDTTDYKADNDLYCLYVESTAQPAVGDIPESYNLDRSLNPGTTGLLEVDSIYNLFFSPKRMLLRNGPFLRSSMYLADNLILKYQTADKNNKVISDGIVEKADVPLSTLGDKFFLPVIFEFDVPAPDNLESILDINPMSIFRFPFYGKTYTGILVKVSVAPSSRKVQTYQLMSTNQDLSDLVNYFG